MASWSTLQARKEVRAATFGAVLSPLGWVVRYPLVLLMAAMAVLTLPFLYARNDGRAGLLSFSAECATYAGALRDWQDFLVEVGASFSTPSVEDCRALVERRVDMPGASLAYAIALLRQGDPPGALDVLRASAEEGNLAAMNTLAALHMEESQAALFKLENSSVAALRVLEQHRFEPNANTHFLLFKAYNSSGDVSHSFRATYNLLRALSLKSKQAQLYIATTPPEKWKLRHGPIILLRAILNEMGFSTTDTTYRLGVEDCVALGKFMQAAPIVGSDGCISVQGRQKCYQIR